MGITTDDRTAPGNRATPGNRVTPGKPVTPGNRATRWRPGRRGALAVLVLVLATMAWACGSSDDDASEAATDTGSFADDGDSASSDESAEFDEPAVDTVDGEGRTVAGSAEEPAPQDSEGDDAMAEEAADGSVDAGSGESGGPLGDGGTSVTPTAADLGRKLIFTAYVTVGVEDVAEASAEATTIIEDLGGFLFGQSTEGGPEARSELVFKVLPDDFNLALERLGAVGELRNQTVTTDDVTERVVDLEGRIEVAELGVERLRAALEGTQSLEDYAEVERLLLARESDLEVMRGQLRTLQDRIDLATITLTLTQERVENRIEVAASVYEGHDEGRSCPASSSTSVEEGSPVTACFEVTNVGDQTLTDIVLTDSVLEIDTGDEDDPTVLIPVFGELDELAPGQSVLLAYETEVERTVRLRTRVVATPTDGASDEPAGPSVNAQASAEVRTFASEEAPGFGDGFGAAVDVLRGLWTAATVTVGFLIPLLVLLPFLWLIWFGVSRVRDRRPPRGPRGPGGGDQPPPPVWPAGSEEQAPVESGSTGGAS